MFFDKFSELCRLKGVSCKKAAMDIGLSGTAASRWKQGVTPNGDTLLKLSEYFSVSVSELIDDNKKSSLSEENELDDLDIEILRLMQKLTPENYIRALAYIQGLVAGQQ